MPNQPIAAAPISRHAEARTRLALADTRIVALVGPRQSGKTTLVRKIAAPMGLVDVNELGGRMENAASSSCAPCSGVPSGPTA